MKAIINNKERDIKDLTIISHSHKNVVNGEDLPEIDYAQYIIVGNNSEWIDWTPLDEFRYDNPEVDI